MIQRLQLITKVIYLLVTVVLAFSGCKNKEDALTLATYTYSTNNRIDNLKPLSYDLEKILERRVEIKSYPDVLSFINGIKSNDVDIGFINTLGYLLLSLDNKNMQPIATLKVRDDAVDNYKTVLLTNNEDITDSTSLKKNADKLSMTFVATGSTSGNLVPRLFLSSIGIESPEKHFKEVNYGGNHTTTLEKLKTGKTDICAIGSNEYCEQLQKDSTLLQSTKVLWMSKEIPLGPVLVNKEFSGLDKERIITLLVNLHETGPETFKSIKEGWSEAKQVEKFYPITDKYYDCFRKVDGKSTHLSAVLNSFVGY
ncbi:PhnD/SsuA/transferrin family substrate-binding protein [Allomuricauda sp. d1]|uniref:phosphate/phosphite/phosphonate ABC transporter substrate-binding protein n=1 Tax=Allomuricauda sp. d1 TaxID=3136725 RepID=UPI0031E3274A